MTAEFVPVDPFDLVIFGGTGDLAWRKLLPALYHRDADGQFSDDSRIFVISRREMTDEAYVEQVRQHLTEHLSERLDEAVLSRFQSRLGYIRLDVTDSSGWQALAERLDNDEHIRAFYLA